MPALRWRRRRLPTVGSCVRASSPSDSLVGVVRDQGGALPSREAGHFPLSRAAGPIHRRRFRATITLKGRADAELRVFIVPGQGIHSRLGSEPVRTLVARPINGPRAASRGPHRRPFHALCGLWASAAPHAKPGCEQELRADSGAAYICLKIVVSPVRVRVSPSPAMPDGRWISLFTVR